MAAGVVTDEYWDWSEIKRLFVKQKGRDLSAREEDMLVKILEGQGLDQISQSRVCEKRSVSNALSGGLYRYAAGCLPARLTARQVFYRLDRRTGELSIRDPRELRYYLDAAGLRAKPE